MVNPVGNDTAGTYGNDLAPGYISKFIWIFCLDEISPTPNECVRDPLNGVISFRIPLVIKGPKETRFKNVLEKNSGKKKKKKKKKKEEEEEAAQKKGSDLSNV
jgi:hypothetical protein